MNNCSLAGRNLQSCKTRVDPAFCSENGRRLQQCKNGPLLALDFPNDDGDDNDDDNFEEEEFDSEEDEVEFEPEEENNLQDYIDYVENWEVGDEFDPPDLFNEPPEPMVCVFNGVDPEPTACMPPRALEYYLAELQRKKDRINALRGPPPQPPVESWLDIVSQLRNNYNGPNNDDNEVGLCVDEMWPLAPRR